MSEAQVLLQFLRFVIELTSWLPEVWSGAGAPSLVHVLVLAG